MKLMKSNSRVILVLLFLLLLGAPAAALAETKFITDTLVVSVRSGPGAQNPVLRKIKTGTPFQVVEERQEHVKLRLDDGLEGWVPKQYVSSQIPNEHIIAQLRSEVERLNSTIAQLEKDPSEVAAQLRTATEQAATYKQEAESAKAQLADISSKYELLLEQSQNVVEIVKERDELLQNKTGLMQQAEELKRENTYLRRKGMVQWFLAGGGVFLAGWLTGKVSRRKSYY